MKRENRRAKSPFAGYRHWLSRVAPLVTVGGLALAFGVAPVGTVPRAMAMPVPARAAVQPNPTVYLYNSNGYPVVTADAVITEGGVYTESDFVGTIDANDNIVDANDEIVGYVVY